MNSSLPHSSRSSSQALRFGIALGLIALILTSTGVRAQGTREDFRRAQELPKSWRNLVTRSPSNIRWLPEGRGVFWQDRHSRQWITVDTEGVRLESKERAALGIPVAEDLLPPQRSWGPSQSGGEAVRITFENRTDRVVRLFWSDMTGEAKPYGSMQPGSDREMSTYSGHVWLGDFAADDLAGIFAAGDDNGIARFDADSRAETLKAANDTADTPAPELRIEDHNVVLVEPDGTRTRLTTDGTAKDSYQLPRSRSPDGRFAFGFQMTPGSKHRIPLIDSSPNDRVQPKLEWLRYRKPGDAIEQRRPRLFDLVQKLQIPIDDALFENSWSVNQVHWSPDSSRVACLYNRRGHQQLAVRSIDVASGKVSTLVDERSETFIDYSQKTFLHWLDDRDQLLWMSERDGHNHLYLFDSKTGGLVRQVTSGDWVVRSVEHVDQAQGQVWLTALGLHADQDPYHAHLVCVDLATTERTLLTEADGNQRWELNEDRSLLITRWSRIDHPEVVELRCARTGSKIAELGRANAKALEASGSFLMPQRFVAKGRDGKTDIHGIIVRPSTFREGARYPVIECIYAGPHGQHVPKLWRTQTRLHQLAELGFIVVRIDGMGTNWRHKAFHDVCWQNLKDAGFPDRIAWLRAAAARHPELDITRVGIYGGSAGGQNALAAVLHHGDFYKAAAADCGCHDNRMDKIWWNEAWMGTLGPHYADSSNVTHASKLTGRLFLTVGELDHNVDPASTLQVVDALLKAGKDFEFYLVPGAGHGVGERPDMVRRRSDFFVRALHGVEPRAD